MDAPPRRWLELGVFAVPLVVLVGGAAGGPGWDLASGHAVLAAHLERAASAPLYGVLAGAAAQLPVGEVGFRLSILSAIIGAATLAGIVAAARAIVPKDPVAGVVAAALLLLAPPFREAAGTASPSLLAACGMVWMIAGAVAHEREPANRAIAISFAGAATVLGSAPWLGAVFAIVGVTWLAIRGAARSTLAIGCSALGVSMILWWLTALGELPGIAPSLTAMVAASGRGAAAIVVGTGLLGAAFGAATGLAAARWLSGLLVVTVAHAIVIDPEPAPLLALLAIGSAIMISAVVRIVKSDRRAMVAIGAGVPLVIAALLTGPALSIDDPGDAPAHLATDLIGDVPSGPGVIVVTSGTSWSAINYAQTVTGARPDLGLVPPLPPTTADTVVADALRAKKLAVSDVPAFGRLDPDRALARDRGFELLGAKSELVAPPPPPATYASAIGERQTVALAISRARYEAGHGRLDAAARALGLEQRFGAGGLAMLATTAPSRDRPALFGYLPRLADPEGGRWRIDLFGDDLAWVAGIAQPLADGPPSRRLHGLWRELLSGARTADDPEIATLGPAAVAATHELVTDVRKP